MVAIIQVMPGVMLILVLIYLVAVTATKETNSVGALNTPWQLPALVSLFFLIWSIYTMVVEPMNGFWTEHTRNFWGNQIWFDLIFGLAIGWTLILPRARAVGMNTVLWFILVAATANIGLSAMLARILYLEDRKKFQYVKVH